MPALRLPAVALAAASLAILSAPMAAAPEKPYRIVAGARVKGTKDAAPAATTLARTTIKGLTVSVEYADGGKRAAFLKTIDPGLADPFASPPGQPERYLAFVVGFQNDAASEVQFQPGNVALISDHKENVFPVDVTDLYMGAERAGRDDLQAVIDRATRTIFDSSTTIVAGGRLARLLVFRPLKERWKMFQVHFSFLQIGSETHTITFTFHKEEISG